MIDRFPLRPDAIWYAALVERYGNAVPAIARFRIRRGLQRHVGDMYATLRDLDLLRHVDIRSIDTRNAGFVIIDAEVRASAFADESIALDFGLEHATTALSGSCEHCGLQGEIILKMGMEALLADPDATLGDRFLCVPCADDFQQGECE